MQVVYHQTFLNTGFVSSKEMANSDSFSFRPEVSPTGIAYLLFTSGSTGQPKGVPIAQSNVRSYLQYVCNRYDMDETDRFSQEFDLTFDSERSRYVRVLGAGRVFILGAGDIGHGSSEVHS